MNRLLTILLLLGATAHGQIDNPPTSVNIVDSTATGRAVLTATNAAAARSAIGAGTVNEGGEPSFESVTANLFTADSINEATGGLQALDLLNFSLTFGTNYVLEWSATDVQLNKPLTFLGTNTAATTRTNLGLGATNSVTFSNITASGTLTAANIAFTNNYFTNDTTFATNVTVGGTLAVTGNVTLSGVNNTMPNATNAASGSSLMTRNLYDERLPITFGLADQAQADFGTVTLANGASGSKAAGGFELTTGSSNNATAVWNASSQATFGRKTTAGTGGVSSAWTGRVMVGWWFVRTLSSNCEIRFQYGRAYNATTHAALSARGVGVRIATNNVFFETHNGTTGFETTNAVTVTNPMFYSAIVEAGVAKFYAGQTLVATVTNSVPTNNSSDNDFGWVMSISNTSTNTSIMRAFANPGFVMQQ